MLTIDTHNMSAPRERTPQEQRRFERERLREHARGRVELERAASRLPEPYSVSKFDGHVLHHIESFLPFRDTKSMYETSKALYKLSNHPHIKKDMLFKYMRENNGNSPYGIGLFQGWDRNEAARTFLAKDRDIYAWIMEHVCTQDSDIWFYDEFKSDEWFRQCCEWMITNENLQTLEFTYRAHLSNSTVDMLAEYLPGMPDLEKLTLDGENQRFYMYPTNLDKLILKPSSLSKLVITDYGLHDPFDGTSIERLAAALRVNTGISILSLQSHWFTPEQIPIIMAALRADPTDSRVPFNTTLMYFVAPGMPSAAMEPIWAFLVGRREHAGR